MNLAHRSRASWLMRIAVMVPMVAISSGCSSDASVGAQGGESVATDGFSQEGGDLGMDLSDLGPPGDAAGDTTGATVDVNRTLPDGEGPDDCDGCFGAPCEGDDDCLSGYCLPTLEGNACSKACEEECPAGFACLPLETGADTTFLCMDEHLTYCYPCAGDSDCGHPLASGLNGRCVVGESWEGSFCASPCHSDDECPSESVCQAVEVDGESSNLCVPIEGACPCYPRAVEDAATTPCSSVNDHGSCDGARMCTDQGLTACDASTPIAELCNDVDDDCDAGVDEAFPDGPHVA